MSLVEYLRDNKIDEISDDQKFMEEEYDAIHTYCSLRDYTITDDDLATIRSRGLEGCFIALTQENKENSHN